MPYSGEGAVPHPVRAPRLPRVPDPADHDVNPPSSYESRTWRIVEEKLTRMAARRPQASPSPPGTSCTSGRHGSQRRIRVRTREHVERLTFGIPAVPERPVREFTPTDSAPDAGIPTTAPSECDPARGPHRQLRPLRARRRHQVVASSPSSADAPPTLPRGMGELAALPPLDYGSCIHHPGRRPVVITPDGGRCGTARRAARSCSCRPGPAGAVVDRPPRRVGHHLELGAEALQRPHRPLLLRPLPERDLMAVVARADAGRQRPPSSARMVGAVPA
jgi:hypothetical protein